jgi:hypothetical protein
MDKLAKMPPDQQKAASQKVMQDIRKAMISMYSTNLTGQVKKARAAGIPDEHPMILDLMGAVKKIKSL